jgi:hypothetical protein
MRIIPEAWRLRLLNSMRLTKRNPPMDNVLDDQGCCSAQPAQLIEGVEDNALRHCFDTGAASLAALLLSLSL